MSRHAVQGMSAPPEVVFDTATDPARRGAWLPRGTGTDTAPPHGDVFEVRLVRHGSGVAGVLHVRPGDAGGSSVELEVSNGPSAEEILWDLERQVGDKFNAG